MKILSSHQIRTADSFTIEKEPIESSDLMERAACSLANSFVKLFPAPEPVVIFCTTGNNGGDGLCLARLLHQRGYTIRVVVLQISGFKPSEDFKLNEYRLKKLPVAIFYPKKATDFPNLPDNNIVVDALFGSGLNRPIAGLAGAAVDFINLSQCRIVAIDLPSGLYADKATPPQSKVVCANYSLSFELPKLAFLLPDNEHFVGKWQTIPIGLDASIIEATNTYNYYVGSEEAKSLVKTPSKFIHKGNRGHVLLIAGMYGKMGACVLSAKAILKAGAGLLSVFAPESWYEIIQTAFPEAMFLPSNNSESIEKFPGQELLNNEKGLPKFQSIAIGPGIGVDKHRAKTFKIWLQTLKQPLVLDADALNMIGLDTLLEFVPKNSILTPHIKEFERMAGKTINGFERLEKLRKLSEQYQIYMVLKGAHTAIACPDGNCFFNSTGNPAMATAGSGDVLTGFIAGLLAQGYTSKESAILGVYLHGLAGDRANKAFRHSITASDIIQHFGLIVD